MSNLLEQLIDACQDGILDVVRSVLSSEPALITWTYSYLQQTPLHIAAKNGHLTAVQKLIQHGAQVEAKTKSGETSLYLGSQTGHLVIVQEVLRHGAQVEVKDAHGRTPLHFAAWYGYLVIVQELLKHGAQVETKDNDGWTTLHYAALHGHLVVIQELVEKNGARLNVKNNDGKSPLDLAKEWYRHQVVSYLKTAREHLDQRKHQAVFWVFVFEHTRTERQSK